MKKQTTPQMRNAGIVCAGVDERHADGLKSGRLLGFLSSILRPNKCSVFSIQC